MTKKYNLNEIKELNIKISKPCIIFLKWDLWAWKTTLSKHIINNLLGLDENITSPTYVYYNKYNNDIFHFDLYRLSSYDEFISIGWEEVLDNNSGVIIIEWPELIQDYYKADIIIELIKTDKDDEREVNIIYN